MNYGFVSFDIHMIFCIITETLVLPTVKKHLETMLDYRNLFATSVSPLPAGPLEKRCRRKCSLCLADRRNAASALVNG